MHIERQGRGPSLAQHDMNLASMMSLMIEEVAACSLRRVDVVDALAICVLEPSFPEVGTNFTEEPFYSRILACSSFSKKREFVVQDGLQGWSSTLVMLE